VIGYEDRFFAPVKFGWEDRLRNEL